MLSRTLAISIIAVIAAAAVVGGSAYLLMQDDPNDDGKTDVPISYDFGVTCSSSSDAAPAAVTVTVDPMTEGTTYTMKAVDSWNDGKVLYEGSYTAGQEIEMSGYGVFEATVTAQFADGHTASETSESLVIDGVVSKKVDWKFQDEEGKKADFITNNRSDSLTLDLHFSDYYASTKKTPERNHLGIQEYAKFVDPDDKYVKEIAGYIEERTKDDTSRERADCALKFVQSFDYAKDPEQFGEPNHAMYPVEFLWTGLGDCEDYAATYASIMKAMGYDTVLFWVKAGYGNHVAVGVSIPDAVPNTSAFNGDHLHEYEGKQYYYCEATATEDHKGIGNNSFNQANVGEQGYDREVKEIIPL